MSPLAFIVVHGGAGVHGHKDEEKVKGALRTACTEALKSFALSPKSSDTIGSVPTRDPDNTRHNSQPHGATLKLVETAIRFLEDDPYLNAGYGSNLTIDGTVECDASIMCAHHDISGPSNTIASSSSATGRSVRFGSVGAVSGVKNPISAARAVLEHSQKKDDIGRVPPLTLVSTGAYSFASSRGVPTVPAETLIAASAKGKWQKWKERLESSSCEHEADGLMDLQDTVGAVAFHERGGVAAGVSSGGLLLKYPGRVGEAAVYGAGCWAASSSPKQFVACSVSGTGEHITKFALARRLGEALAHGSSEEEGGDHHGILETSLRKFWELGRDEGDLVPSAGVVVLTAEGDDGHAEWKVRLWCGFTTASMAIAYASTEHMKSKAMIVRRPHPMRGEQPQIYITSWLL